METTTQEPSTRTVPGPVMRTALNPTLRTESVVALGTFTALTVGAALLGGRQSSADQLWYRRLRKPPYQPPSKAFAPVWTVLYGLIAISGWRVWTAPAGARRSKALTLWGVQLGLNAAWSWLFFGKHQPRRALVDNLALLGSIGAYVATSRNVDRPAAWMVAPYLAWVGFANVLNAEIVRRNA
ncbi:tryptophan-rich sensory protein [Pyxidicoccus parkwayensis]|uniref:Tryptophan-rich sensory protein n=1 Tax=Pyxidicoccus parkwayensis TaxID=2813578 RepID=A0ABX7NX37_9BACT|nr:TspO/MBR family protein [Pyxidicoccus parkwaysis]QSQ20663.1 tryptophan-rich sensory protein [Pyxidicoccus parkwaysis]